MVTAVLNKSTTVDGGVKSAPFYKYCNEESSEIYDMIDGCKALVDILKRQIFKVTYENFETRKCIQVEFYTSHAEEHLRSV